MSAPGDWKSQRPVRSLPAQTGTGGSAGRPGNGGSGFNRRAYTWQRWATVALLLASWAALLARLADVPPGLQHDQTFNILDAIELLYGRYRLYFPANYGREPLFIYTAAAVLRLVGADFAWALRLTGVVWGFVGLAATCVLSRRWLRGWLALLPPALLAGSFWFLLTARVGLRAISALTVAAFMLYFLDRGLARRSLNDLLLAGLCGGVSVYTYLSARGLLALVPLLLLYLAVAQLVRRGKPGDGKLALGLLASWGVSLAVSAPLLFYLRTNPGSTDRRIGELAGPLAAALSGQFGPLLRTIGEGLTSLLWADRAGEPYQYNIPGRPGLSLPLALFFLIGLAFMLARCFSAARGCDGRARLWVTALALALAPALVAPGGPLYLRAIIALPLLYIFAVYGLQRIAQTFPSLWPVSDRATLGPGRMIPAAVLLIALCLHWGESMAAYFGTWATARQTALIYNADLRAAATYLADQPADEPVYVSTDFWLDLDQQTYLLHRPKRRDVGWFNGARGLPLPGPAGGIYLWLVSAPNTSSALGALSADANVTDGLFRAVRLAPVTVEARLADLGLRPVTGSPDYGDTLRLEAATARPLQVTDATVVEVVSRWQVLAPWSRPAPPKLAVVLSDATGYTWAQTDDYLAVAYQQWQPGEGLLQVTQLALPADFPGGDFRVMLRLYEDAGGALPVSRAGQALADTPVAVAVTLPAAMDARVAPRPPHPLTADTAAAALIAVGTWEQPADWFAGVPVEVRVSWRAETALDTADVRFRLTATDATTGALLWEQPADPAQPLPQAWPAGQTWRLTHRIVPQTPEQGTFTARLRLCALTGGVESCATLGDAQVTNRPILLDLPREPQVRVPAVWDSGLALEGYDLAANGDELALTLYWRAGEPPAARLARFVHVVDAADKIVAQPPDETPPNGGVPMTLWRAGEVIVDTVTLAVPGVEVARLYVGWYDPATGVRVPVRGPEDTALPDGRWVIPVAP